jgi:hypothetical protein
MSGGLGDDGFQRGTDGLSTAPGHLVKCFPSLWVKLCGEENALSLGAEAMASFALIVGIHEASNLSE